MNDTTQIDTAAYAPLATPRGQVTSPQATVTGGGILTSMAAMLGMQLADTFFCQICLNNAVVSQSHQLTTCGHRFCTSCLQSYVTFHIQERETEIKCFYQEITTTAQEEVACLTSIPLEEIEQLVDTSTYAKLMRFRFNKSHSNARQCPYCDHNQLCHGETIQCESCGRAFCFVHGNAHPGESCRAYMKRTRKEEKQNLATINRMCKPCPGCGQLVEKDGGCNQVKCWACKTSFCWLCRQCLDDSTYATHYLWWNSGGCTGSQLTSDGEQINCERMVLAFFRGLFYVVLSPPAFLLAVAISLLCCCCYPCTKIFQVSYRQAFLTGVCICGYILLLPLLIPGALLFLPCILIAYWAKSTSFTEIGHDQQRLQSIEKTALSKETNDSPV